MGILVNRKNFPDQQLIVFFPEEEKRVGVKPIRILGEKMDEQAIKEASVRKVRIEVFDENELIVNITHHELVPQHVPLTEEEKQQLLQRYKLKPSQLPRVQQQDPIARYFGMQHDQVM